MTLSAPPKDQRAVLITGCSSGIGRCLAHGLKRRGYRVFASARKAADVAVLRRHGLESLLLDLDSSDSIERAIAEVLARTDSKLYAVVNNGAYGQPGAVEDLSRAALRRQFETNLFGPHELTAGLLPALRAQGRGRVVQISSMLGYVCLPYRGAYNASKYALEALSDTMRLELRGTGIYVSLIEPGPIESRFRSNARDMFNTHIDTARSSHRSVYASLSKRLAGERGEPPFTLPPKAVLKKVIHALEAAHPRARYRVTFPAHLFAVLKRLLPAPWVDVLLLAASGAGTRA